MIRRALRLKRPPPGRAAVIAVLMLAIAPGAAQAAISFPSGSPLSSANESFITNMPTQPGSTSGFYTSQVLDDGTNLYVGSAWNYEQVWKFPRTGGSTSDAGVTHGDTHNAYSLALDDGTYFTSGTGTFPPEVGGVFQFDPTGLARGSMVSPATPANAITVDPVTGDLYAAIESGGPGGLGYIQRIQQPASASPVTSTFATGIPSANDLTFSPDGSRLYTTGDASMRAFDRSGTLLFSVDLSAHQSASTAGGSGVAVAPPNTTVGGVNISNNVFVNSGDGTLNRIDVNNANTVSTVASGINPDGHGKPRVGPDGCMYLPTFANVIKFAPCIFQPDVHGKAAGPGPGPGPAPGPAPGNPSPPFNPFLGSFAALFGRAVPASSVSWTHSVVALPNGQSALPVQTNGACDLKVSEARVSVASLRTGSLARVGSAARVRPRKAVRGLFAPAHLTALAAGRQLVPLRLTAKARAAVKRALKRRHVRGRARISAAALRTVSLNAGSDSFRVGCTPLKVPLTTIGGQPAPAQTGGGTPAGPPQTTTVNVGGIKLQIPIATANTGGNGPLNQQVAYDGHIVGFPHAGGVRVHIDLARDGKMFVTGVDGSINAPGQPCPVSFLVDAPFPANPTSRFPLTGGSFAFAQNKNVQGHRQTVILNGGVDAKGGGVFIVAGQPEGLCSENAAFTLVRVPGR